MHPILFHLGPFPVYAFGAMVALGVLLCLALMSKRCKQPGEISFNDAMDLVYTAVFSGFAGARLLYVFENPEFYERDAWKVFAIWEGGLIFYGGVAGALIGIFAASKFKKIPFLSALDFLIPYESLTHAFGRLGCFLNGCCYGKYCDLPWAVNFREAGAPAHPAQLYEAFALILLFLFLNARYPRRRFPGQIIGLYFILYGFIRFFMEFVRDNPMFWLLTYNQWISIGLIAFGVLVYWFQARRNAA